MDKLAYLAGAFRDGSFVINEKEYIYRAVIYQKNEEWIRLVAGFLHDCFGKKPIVVNDSRELWRAVINSRNIYEKIVKNFEFDGDQKSWNTPSFILNGNLDKKKSYIAGFFDAEGSINSFDKIEPKYVKPKDVRIYFAQANRIVLEELKSLIEEFGVNCGKVCGPYVKNGTNTDMYALIIHGRKECLRFYETFGSLHSDKIARFMLLAI